MTVDELLDRIIGLPGVTPEAMKTYAPVFRARFEKRQGEHLRAAFEEALAAFKPTRNQPFPIPADIEQFMPSLRQASGEGGPPIRAKLEKRALRARVMLEDWLAGQGAKIKAQRAPQLYNACMLVAAEMAKDRALDDRVSGIVLTRKEIDHCYQSALSTERVKRHGRPPADPHLWWQQLTEIATEWKLEITPAWWSEKTAKALAEREAA